MLEIHRLQCISASKLKNCFQTTFSQIKSKIKIKDTIPKRLKSKLVYGIHCTDCDTVYIGKTKYHLSTRFREHRDLKQVSAVSSHLTSTGHDALFDDVKIFEYGKTDTKLLIKESLIIKQFNPRLNATVKSFPMEMFQPSREFSIYLISVFVQFV